MRSERTFEQVIRLIGISIGGVVLLKCQDRIENERNIRYKEFLKKQNDEFMKKL